MGHNLEKNLRKIQGLKSKGQLEKALKQLQDWARRHPDTPHYLFEAAMVAFDLEDYGVGLTSLKSLVRTIPQTRERVQKACIQRFNDRPALPLAEYLVEDLVGQHRLDDALEVIGQLDESQLGLYARKTAMRHDSLTVGGDTRPESLRLSLVVSLLVSHTANQADRFAECVEKLLESEGIDAAQLVDLCSGPVAAHPDHTGVRFAAARAKLAAGRLAEGCSEIDRVCRGDAELAAKGLETIAGLEPDDDAKGRWLATQGYLHLATGNGAKAAARLLEAADADADLRQEILDSLGSGPEPSEGLGEILKLRLRLLVVQAKYNDVPELVQRLRGEGHCEEAEIRSLMGQGRRSTDPRPTELLVVFTETALAAGDLRAAATHVAEIPDTEAGALHKILGVLDKAASEQPEESRLEWLALLAVVQARVGSEQGASETLTELWSNHDQNAQTLLAITRTCLEKVAPQPELVIALLRREDVDSELRVQTMSELVSDIDSDVEDLSDQMIELLREHPHFAGVVLETVDECPRELGISQRLRYPVAIAALLTGDTARAVPELSVLLISQPMLTEEVLEWLRNALHQNPLSADLNLAMYDLLVDQDQTAEAALCLGRALRADPSRVKDFSESFDNLLQKNPDDVELWQAFADALFHVGRYEQLNQLCEKASEVLPSRQLGGFRLLQAHMLVEEGRLSEGLELLEQELDSDVQDTDRALEILRSLLTANPANTRAQLLLAMASGRKGEITEAIAAYQTAVRVDPSVLPEVMERLKNLAALPATEGTHLLEMARIYRRSNDDSQAAVLFGHALKLDPDLAQRVLGELGPELESATPNLDLLFVGSRAARVSGNVELGCKLLNKIESQAPDRFERVLVELRKLGSAVPGNLLPIRHAARTLLKHHAVDAATQILLDSGRNEEYPLPERVKAIREYRKSQPSETRVGLALADLLRETSEFDEAARLLQDCLQDQDLDTEAAADVASRLVEAAPTHMELAWANHDILVRLGKVDEALHSLPDPQAVDEQHAEKVSKRFAANAARVLKDPVLAPRYVASLQIQGLEEEAIQALTQAADAADGDASLDLKSELAKALHESGRSEECNELLADMSKKMQSKQRFFQMFEHWNRQRLSNETDALRQRVSDRPDRGELALRLAQNLLDMGQAEEVPELLSRKFENQEDCRRRACLLARAHLELGRADVAEAVLRAAPEGRESEDELQFLIAECAAHLGRWGEAHVRFSELLDSSTYGLRAQSRAREAYKNYLADSAQEYRAVLCKVTDLDASGDRIIAGDVMNENKTTEYMDEETSAVDSNPTAGDDVLTPAESAVLDALERLTDATDDVAHKLIANLDEMREDFQHDWKGTRTELKKLQDAQKEEMQEAIDALRSALDSGDESGKAREQGIRSALAESQDGLLDHIDRSNQKATDRLQDHVTRQVTEAKEGLEKNLGEFQDDQTRAMDSLKGDQADALDSMKEDQAKALESLKEDQKNAIDAMRDDLSSLSDKMADLLESKLEAFEARLSGLQEEIQDMNEAFQSRHEKLENRIQEMGSNVDERLESSKTTLEDQMSRMDEKADQLTAMGANMEESHRTIQRFFEQERDRAERAESAQEREEARRLNNAGVSRFHAGEFSQAAELFEQAVERDQHFAEAFNNMGLCYTELSRHDDATVAFETAIELNPDLGAGYNNLGYVLYKRENYEAAIEMYKEAIGHSHDTSAAYTNLGNAYQKLDQIEKAVASWEMALQADQNNDRARRYLDRYTGGMNPDAADDEASSDPEGSEED